MYCIKCDQNGKEPLFKSPSNNLKKIIFLYTVPPNYAMLCIAFF